MNDFKVFFVMPVCPRIAAVDIQADIVSLFAYFSDFANIRLILNFDTADP